MFCKSKPNAFCRSRFHGLSSVIAGEQRSPQTNLGQLYSINCIGRFLSEICPRSWDARVVPTNMHGMWPLPLLL